MSLQLIGLLGYLTAALGFSALALLLAFRRPSAMLGKFFLAIVVIQAFWAWTMAATFTKLPSLQIFYSLFETCRTLSWTIFVAALIKGTLGQDPRTDKKKTTQFSFSVPRLAVAASLATALAIALLEFLEGSGQTILTLKVIAPVIGLVCLEQTYRATPLEYRWSLKFLMIALAGLFAFDLVMYSDALLFSRLNLQWWIARGYANAFLVPLLIITASRNRDWKTQITMSRNMVFHSSVLLIIGAYLTAASLLGYYVRYAGGDWGEIAQTVMTFAAVISLVLILVSGEMRARLRVFLAKNFFNHRFDYRLEWLRLTDTLHSAKPNAKEQGISAETLIKSMGRIVDSTGGVLWLRRDNSFPIVGKLGFESLKIGFNATDPILEFMARKDWIIDLEEYRRNRSAYESIVIPNDLLIHTELWILVPLTNTGQLEGLLALTKPISPTSLNWEVRDILKVAARQVASLVSLQNAVESLVQSRQFDSFNKMSAFVVHDLKNLVSQLSLLVRNATTHRHDPEFQKDMLETVENVLEKMQGLLMQLRLGTKPIEKPETIGIEALIGRSISAKKGLKPVPVVVIPPELKTTRILAHPERIERVLGHLIQNACEAMQGREGRLEIIAQPNSDKVSILVKDTGIGMSENFIQTQLFKPFNSTKAQGMGIGTFESREYLKEIGGSLSVTSQEKVGTTFKIELATAPQ